MVASFAVHVSSDIGCARHEVRVILLHARFGEQGSKETRPQARHRCARSCAALGTVISELSLSRRLFILVTASSQVEALRQ